jgi:hypothetical protein
VTPEKRTSSKEHFGTNLVCPILMPQPNKTKLPLQVLAVAVGNSEKNKVWDEAHDGVILCKHETYLIV